MRNEKERDRHAQRLVAAFAIEDWVEFTVEWESGVQSDPPFAGLLYRELIDPDAPNYFAEVRRHMETALTELYKAARKASEERQDRAPSAWKTFFAIDMLCISCPGVIKNNHTLVQLPLWHWKTEGEVRWYWAGVEKVGFNFGEEVYSILWTIAQNNNDHRFKRFLQLRSKAIEAVSDDEKIHAQRSVIVVNDVAACAAAEYVSFGDEEASPKYLAYVKCHDGVNVGTITEGYEGGTPHNAEMGHFYPNYHEMDLVRNYSGSCPFHGDCLEGMINSSSFRDRLLRSQKIREGESKEANSKEMASWERRLRPWRAFVDAHEADSMDAEFAAFLVGNKGYKGDDTAIEILSHYLAQLVHHLVLQPIAPDAIVLGGKLISDRVVYEVQTRVLVKLRGYPLRPELGVDKLRSYIRRSRLTPKGDENIDLAGAVAIARRWATKRREQEWRKSSHNAEDVLAPLWGAKGPAA